MSLAVLSCVGEGLDVDGFLRKWPKFGPDHVWHRGDVGVRGHVAKSSGFSVAIAAEGEDEMVKELGRFLRRRAVADMLKDLRARGAEGTVDIALHVGDRTCFANSVAIGPGLLRRLAQLSLELEVSGYPVSD